MCLTEPHCGTDLGLIRTKAEPAGDGSYKITGTKIFISAGEHDLTKNIIHLVLARLPDAPAGIAGISLFLVPKFMPKREGDTWVPGPRNGVACGSIEHKMGIKASSTCVINFDAATGWLVGQPHRGHAPHVHHDERRAPRRRHAGPGPRRGRLSERAQLTRRSASRAARSRARNTPTSRPIRSSSIPTSGACCSR